MAKSKVNQYECDNPECEGKVVENEDGTVDGVTFSYKHVSFAGRISLSERQVYACSVDCVEHVIRSGPERALDYRDLVNNPEDEQ